MRLPRVTTSSTCLPFVGRRAMITGLLVGIVVLFAGCAGAPARPAARSHSAASLSGRSLSGRSVSGQAPGPSASDHPAVAGASVRTASLTGRWRHVVVVVEENRDENRILGSRNAPYLNRLARGGLVLTDMHGEAHPSEPNYLALFSGSTQGVRDDSCPHAFRGDNLGHQLRSAGRSFGSFAESLPRTGSGVCRAGAYARRHAPWTDFTNVPRALQRPMTAFPRTFDQLPAVAFVIPNLNNDMHDGSVARGDRWLQSRLGRYATWARTHHSLLLVTWDEDENTRANHIATIAYGHGIRPGRWTARADHYSLLATLERSFGLPRLGAAAHRAPITPLL